MRGQWISYDCFNLIDLIDEIKSRVQEPHSADDILHGAMIVGKDYFGTCKELKEFLNNDDKKGAIQVFINENGITYVYPDGRKETLKNLLCKQGIII